MSNPIPENKPGSREFEESMQAFERTVLKYKGSPSAIREAREFWKHGAYYQDGQRNELFKGFIHGMAYARNLVNLS